MREPDYFLQSREWRVVRMRCLERDGARCACCGRTAADGIVINVDHIKPRARYPELALDVNNLQVLCNECNHGKGNQYETNWKLRQIRWFSWVCGENDQRTAEVMVQAWRMASDPLSVSTGAVLSKLSGMDTDTPFVSFLRDMLIAALCNDQVDMPSPEYQLAFQDIENKAQEAA